MMTWRRPSRRAARSEGPWAWLAAGSVATSLALLALLLGLLAVRGLGHFWPAEVSLVALDDGRQLAGWAVKESPLPGGDGRERLYRTGNRDLDGAIWDWVDLDEIREVSHPSDLVVLERRRWSEFIGRLEAVETESGERISGESAWPALERRLTALEQHRASIERLRHQVIRPLVLRLEAGEASELERERLSAAQEQVREQQAALPKDILILETVDGRQLRQPLTEVTDALQPNAMGVGEKVVAWSQGVWRFLSEGPRAANTAGGVWPAIFGTVLMVVLMSIFVTPFGVLAAVYLNEVAHQGRLTHWVRIGVRNLAGVPSIVYGVFGLGVFVYGIGGHLDDWFFSSSLPSPTFGTGGLLWASLTLALLTLPVVIVATEEGLARIPESQREGALALGATRFEMLTRIVLPMAMPAMLTGVILAVARAAGEVAPLMLVGVAKLAPQVPVDGEFPFLHLDRKFMHLGYHIFDAAFHGGDVQAAMPLIYATALLLVLVILVLNLTAIFLRHHLRSRHGTLSK
ncbi:phosphate ABC transporter permease PstA [Halomonas caseinilytica]|uniref:Phosphate transport system permease protein PstA n=1 Tax=Halomonas caseinilytica TaxID=438744 RepID=A0A1M6WJ86_9GAMM|nr:phosphate ABC transporter permease PstA [Halomonas caseinilytica]SEM85326.1 phosphate transport system permease protein [Halomonas caseinilytica]SHK93820.1 phosphate transport system permease protein [Halomonas caseinilytica]